jgi:uncharacterized membrane protein
MRLAFPLPWWGYVLACAGVAVLAWLAYWRMPAALAVRTRVALSGLRALTLAAVVLILLRPVVDVPPSGAAHALVPILIDVSRSMQLADAGGPPRIERAQAIARELRARLEREYRVEVLGFGESLAAADLDHLAATARRSDLADAVAALGDRHRSDRVAGIVVLSDGGDTSEIPRPAASRLTAPVLAVGIGSATAARDREIVNLTAGEPLLPGASIDLSVSAVSAGFGREPVELRVTANGRPIEVRRVAPSSDGAPIHEVFTVSPAADVPTVYTIETPPAPGELTADNNRRSVLVPPQTGRRRILVVEGAPGFEHTFLKRALARDPGLELDAVVKKGQNDDGRDTFFVQASASRLAALANGYPLTRAELFRYDGLVFGNIDAAFFTRDQLAMTANFVAERGGGLVLLGARSFDRQALAGTPLDEVLPTDLTDRPAGVARASAGGLEATPNTPVLTTDGLTHPATRLAPAVEDSRKRWAELPPLASVSEIGGPRPGAQVLAVAGGAAGSPLPLIATQRYGQGRSVVFAGEASWRWRMLRPATDTTFETIWRQLVRWATAGSPGQVSIVPMTPNAPGVTERIVILVRDEEFRPMGDADVSVRVTAPDGDARDLRPALSSPGEGRYAVAVRFDSAGVYRLDASATRGRTVIGTTSRQILVGGVDMEMSQPRLNDAVLRRLALASGGRYVPADQAAVLPSLVTSAQLAPAAPQQRDLWHNGWSLAFVIGLLSAEWIVRRRAGLA